MYDKVNCKWKKNIHSLAEGAFFRRCYPASIPHCINNLPNSSTVSTMKSAPAASSSPSCYFRVIVGSELDGRRDAKEEVVAEALRQLEEARLEKKEEFGELRLSRSGSSIPKARRAYCTDVVIPSFGSVKVPSKSNNKYLYFISFLHSLLCRPDSSGLKSASAWRSPLPAHSSPPADPCGEGIGAD